MDKIDRIRKIISEAKVTSSEDRPSSSPQDAAKQRALAQREKQKKLLGKIKERQADRKKYVPQKPLENISQSIKKAKFSKLNKVSDDGETGVTAVGQTAGNVVKAVGNIAKAGAKVARKGIKAGKVVGNEVGLAVDSARLNRMKAQKQQDKKRKKLAKIMGEQFIQEVEDKKDKVDKVIDIMRGKNKIQINPDVKESVDKT